jgi:OFA family oxalate/formate antiporter-like MFS transporter
MNRWFVVIGALLIQIALGAVYIWSVFKKPLMDLFKWDGAATSLTYSITILMFAIGTIIFGKVQDKIGPKKVATIGGIMLAIGLILSSMTTSVTWLYISFGVIGGLGIGAGYVCPLATCVKWFPDKKGLITGLAVAGFGGGALVFTPIAKAFITSFGILKTFTYLGIIFGICVIVGAQFLKNPPAGYKPAGWNPPEPVSGGKAGGADFSTSQMMKTGQFYLIWISYLFGAAAGLMIIGQALPIATAQGLDAALAVSAVMIVSVFNSLGRLLWGTISDKLGRIKTLVVIFIICGITMICLKFFVGTMILVGVSLVGFCFGGFLALYPSLTADYFGTKFLGMNYGTVFLSYGIAGVAGPMLYDLMKSPVAGQLSSMPFIISGILCFVSLVLVLMAKPPVKA